MQLKKFIREFKEKKENLGVTYVYLKDGSTLFVSEYKFSHCFDGQILIYFEEHYIGHISLKSIKRLM